MCSKSNTFVKKTKIYNSFTKKQQLLTKQNV